MRYLEPFSARTRQPAPLLMIEEITHRVVNEYAQAISGLNLAASNVLDGQAKAALHAAAGRLLAQADAHRALQAPRDSGRRDLAGQLERLGTALATASLNDRGVRLTLCAEETLLDAGRAWRATLIVSELVTNAIRHGLRGGEGEVHVELSHTGGQVLCRVTDNGSSGPNPPVARGRKLVLELAGELQGRVDWCFSADGSSAILRFPIERLSR